MWQIENFLPVAVDESKALVKIKMNLTEIIFICSNLFAVQAC